MPSVQPAHKILRFTKGEYNFCRTGERTFGKEHEIKVRVVADKQVDQNQGAAAEPRNIIFDTGNNKIYPKQS
ncbi:hypothetical protein GCM10010912_08430 [Paenibacillus albidus]|uniref:Uncharacterized protein n=1 Tax=Paenibacillus albidus TaxID=2041023 RepID=A0A917C188_9BACL|nr:hypothetical protein GCM10010912_08430 [Paenibacillus albidus]